MSYIETLATIVDKQHSGNIATVFMTLCWRFFRSNQGRNRKKIPARFTNFSVLPRSFYRDLCQSNTCTIHNISSSVHGGVATVGRRPAVACDVRRGVAVACDVRRVRRVGVNLLMFGVGGGGPRPSITSRLFMTSRTDIIIFVLARFDKINDYVCAINTESGWG